MKSAMNLFILLVHNSKYETCKVNHSGIDHNFEGWNDENEVESSTLAEYQVRAKASVPLVLLRVKGVVSSYN